MGTAHRKSENSADSRETAGQAAGCSWSTGKEEKAKHQLLYPADFPHTGNTFVPLAPIFQRCSRTSSTPSSGWEGVCVITLQRGQTLSTQAVSPQGTAGTDPVPAAVTRGKSSAAAPLQVWEPLWITCHNSSCTWSTELLTHPDNGSRQQHSSTSSPSSVKKEVVMRDNPSRSFFLPSSTDKEALAKTGKFLEDFIPSFCLEHLPTAFCSSSAETIVCAHSLLFMFPPLPQLHI